MLTRLLIHMFDKLGNDTFIVLKSLVHNNVFLFTMLLDMYKHRNTVSYNQPWKKSVLYSVPLALDSSSGLSLAVSCKLIK